MIRIMSRPSSQPRAARRVPPPPIRRADAHVATSSLEDAFRFDVAQLQNTRVAP